MLEILFLRWFAKNLAATAKEKGRPGTWGALGVILWIVGEVAGFAVTGFDGGASYLAALFCAAVGAAIAAGIVHSLGTIDAPIEHESGPANANYDPSNPYSPPPGGTTRS